MLTPAACTIPRPYHVPVFLENVRHCTERFHFHGAPPGRRFLMFHAAAFPPFPLFIFISPLYATSYRATFTIRALVAALHYGDNYTIHGVSQPRNLVEFILLPRVSSLLRFLKGAHQALLLPQRKNKSRFFRFTEGVVLHIQYVALFYLVRGSNEGFHLQLKY